MSRIQLENSTRRNYGKLLEFFPSVHHQFESVDYYALSSPKMEFLAQALRLHLQKCKRKTEMQETTWIMRKFQLDQTFLSQPFSFKTAFDSSFPILAHVRESIQVFNR